MRLSYTNKCKLELMTFAINNDFWEYGSRCYKRKDGKYIAIVDGERTTYTAKGLIKEFEGLEAKTKREILSYYYERIRG